MLLISISALFVLCVLFCRSCIFTAFACYSVDSMGDFVRFVTDRLLAIAIGLKRVVQVNLVVKKEGRKCMRWVLGCEWLLPMLVQYGQL